jgi:hypothetical protein
VKVLNGRKFRFFFEPRILKNHIHYINNSIVTINVTEENIAHSITGYSGTCL